MPKISYKSSNFASKDSRLFGVNDLQFTWAELFWASVTIGRRRYSDVLIHGVYSKHEIDYRASMILANLLENPSTNEIERTPAFLGLDPTEKGAVSYYLGMVFSKLLSEKILNVPWLMHIAIYKDKYPITKSISTKSMPDLIGLNKSREWFVIEAKGRVLSVAKALKEAKKQADVIATINNRKPKYKIGLMAYFTKTSGRLKISWDDPDNHLPDSLNPEIDIDNFLREYYLPIISIFDQNSFDLKEINNEEYMCIYLKKHDFTLGLNKGVYELLKSDGYEILVAYILAIQIPDLKDEYSYFGNDGVLISLGQKWRVKSDLINLD